VFFRIGLVDIGLIVNIIATMTGSVYEMIYNKSIGTLKLSLCV